MIRENKYLTDEVRGAAMDLYGATKRLAAFYNAATRLVSEEDGDEAPIIHVVMS